MVREAQKGGQIDQNKTLVDSQTRAKFRTLSAKTKHGASACRPAAIDSLLLSLDIKYSSLHEKKNRFFREGDQKINNNLAGGDYSLSERKRRCQHANTE